MKKTTGSGSPTSPRQQADGPTCTKVPALREELEPLSKEKLQYLLHELQTHKIKLEMQVGHLKQTRAELERSRDQYCDLYEHAPVGYLTLDELGVIVRANCTVAELLGVIRETLPGRLLTSFILPNDVDIFYLHRKYIDTTGKSQVFEIRLVRHDGTHLWTRIEAVLKQEKNGESLCCLAVSDISSGKKMEMKLQESEKRLRLALNAAYIGEWEFNMATGKSLCSTRFGKILGYAEPLSSCPLHFFVEHIHPEDRLAVETSLQELLINDRDWYGEFRVTRADRTLRWLWGMCSSLNDDMGKRCKMFVMIADITERKMAEAEQKNLEAKQLEQERVGLTRRMSERNNQNELSLEMQLGWSRIMQKVISDIRKLAASDYSLIIEGETGTGKTLAAGLIHNLSSRSQGPFIVLDISTIPESLVESELFGYEKGAFTGADRKKKGFFEIADGGTVFIDELQNMTPYVQSKILKVVEERCFYPVGATHPVETDIRMIGATNSDFRLAVKEKRFREDLYYRLNEASLRLPPLRERSGDIVHFAEKFLVEVSLELNRFIRILDDQVLVFLKRQYWPGNVRELKNVIRKAALFCDQNEMTLEAVTRAMTDTCIQTVPAEKIHGLQGQCVPLSIPEAEKNAIRLALSYTDGNKTKAAEALQISLKTLLAKIRKYSL
jgi:PAS domain S-box-containing protein